MRILYINCSETNFPWGAECAVGQELAQRGHDVVDLDYRRERPRLYRLFADGFEKRVLPDVIFLQRGEQFPVEIIESFRAPTVYWATEVWWKEQHNLLLERPELFQHVWVHDRVMKRLMMERTGAANVSVLFNGYDQRLFYPAYQECQHDILFYGALNQRRMGILRRLGDFDVRILTNCYGDKLRQEIQRSKIVLNLHFGEARDFESRVLETLGTGACLVTETLADEALDAGLVAGAHYVEFQRFEELTERLRQLLEDSELRLSITGCGHRKVASNHTWAARCNVIEEKLMEISNVH